MVIGLVGIVESVTVWFAIPYTSAEQVVEIVRAAPNEKAALSAVANVIYRSTYYISAIHFIFSFLTFIISLFCLFSLNNFDDFINHISMFRYKMK